MTYPVKERLVIAAILFWVGAALNVAGIAVTLNAPWWLITVAGWAFIVGGFMLSHNYYKAHRS